jgi:hypothetical protein
MAASAVIKLIGDHRQHPIRKDAAVFLELLCSRNIPVLPVKFRP